MLILTYFKPKDGLPNPKGPLSLSIPSQAIALANSEVAKATTDKSKKCGPYILLLSMLPDKHGSIKYSRVFELFHDDELVHV